MRENTEPFPKASVRDPRALAVVGLRATHLPGCGTVRTTQRRQPKIRSDEKRLTAAIIRLAKRYGRYGYRRVTVLLRAEGWKVNVKRVHRIWRREGLKVLRSNPSAVGFG